MPQSGDQNQRGAHERLGSHVTTLRDAPARYKEGFCG
jgi:hypothetical protein